jgi:gliding motility-associated-like protein
MKANYTLYTNRVRAFFALTLICVFGYVQAQQDNVWVITQVGTKSYILDFNTIPPSLTHIDTSIVPNIIDGYARSYCNFNTSSGKLKYYYGLDSKVYNKNHKAQLDLYDSSEPSAINGLPVVVANQEYLITNNARYDTGGTIPSKVFSMNPLAEVGPMNGNVISDLSVNELDSLPYEKDFAIAPKDDDEIYILSQHSDKLRITAYNPLLNQVTSDKYFFENIQWQRNIEYQQLTVSPDFKTIAMVIHTEIEGDTHTHSSTIAVCSFDRQTGNVGPLQKVYINKEYYTSGSAIKSKVTLRNLIFSADNAYIYSYFRGLESAFEAYPALLRVRLSDKKVEEFRIPYSLVYYPRLGPNGKIYLFPNVSRYNKPESRYIGVINEPSSTTWRESIELQNKELDVFDGPTNLISGLISLPRTNGYYVKVNFEESNACAGLYTSFENTTDSTHFERYRFYFGDGDSAEIGDDNNLLLAGRDNIANEDAWGVKHRYTKAGTYLVKLRAYNAAGGWVWYSHEVVVVEPSIPKFSVADTIGCEWIAYQIQDLSRVVNKGKDIMYHWTFGDGTDSTITFPLGEGWDGATNTKQYKTYSQSGDYKIQLTIDDGYCIDSFNLNNNVEILEAPRPGITAAPVEGCSPVRVEVNTTYSDVRDSVIYTWGDGTASTSILGESSHTYLLAAGVSTSQYLTIYQSIHGPTGCVTTDSQTVIVHPGFLSADTPYLSLVTVNPNQQIEITWDSFPGATGYQLFRNGAWLADAATSNYTDASTKESLHEIATYTIYGTNVCEEKTLQSNIDQNIVLTGKGSEDNTISFLEWTPYQKWKNGVVDYAIAVQNDDNSFTEIYRENANGTKKYTDETFLASALSGFATYKCYRIAAYELDYPQQISYSNVECVPFKPVIFIPTAITPNGDNLNDVYRPVTFGIEFYEVKVYNRYGQLIADFDQNSKGWNAADAPTGAYMVTIRAKGTDNLWYNEKSTVTVVR